MERCHICLTRNRIKFWTARISICQQCINKIRGMVYEKSVLYRYLMEAINRECQEHTDRIKNVIFESLVCGVFEKYNSKRIYSRIDGEIIYYNKPKLSDEEKFFLRLFRAHQFKLLSEKIVEMKRDDDATWFAKKDSIILEDGYKCNLCRKQGRTNGLHLHHIIPLDEYGTNNPANLVLLCPECHQKQHGFRIGRKEKKENADMQFRNVKISFIPENIKEEWEALNRLSPEAAELALNDTPEGRSIRSRLEEYGADLALDRAEFLILKAKLKEFFPKISL